MRAGIIASQLLASSGGVEVPLSGAINFNFRTGTYLIDAGSVSIADYIDHPDDVIATMGLYGGSSSRYNIETLLSLSDKFLTGSFGLIIDWVRLGTVCEPVYVSNVGDDPKFSITDSKTVGILASDSDGATTRDLEEGSPAGLGQEGVRHVMAINRTNALIEMSLDGGAVISDATAQGWHDITNAWLGGPGTNSTGRIIFRRLILDDPFETADLPTLSANSGAPEALANDNFASRVALTLDVPILLCNLSATAEAGEPDHAGIPASTSLWCSFTAPASADYTVTVAGDISADDPALAVYTGTAVGSLSEVAAATTPPYNVVTFSATSGTSYAIAVDLFYFSGFTVVVEAA